MDYYVMPSDISVRLIAGFGIFNLLGYFFFASFGLVFEQIAFPLHYFMGIAMDNYYRGSGI